MCTNIIQNVLYITTLNIKQRITNPLTTMSVHNTLHIMPGSGQRDLLSLPPFPLTLAYPTYEEYEQACTDLVSRLGLAIDNMVMRMSFGRSAAPLMWTSYDLLVLGVLDSADLIDSLQVLLRSFLTPTRNTKDEIAATCTNLTNRIVAHLETVCRVHISTMRLYSLGQFSPNLEFLNTTLKVEMLQLLGTPRENTGILGSYIMKDAFVVKSWHTFTASEWDEFEDAFCRRFITLGLDRDTIMLIANYVDSKESGWAWETVQTL